MKVLGLTLVPSRFEGPESPGLSLGTLSSRSPGDSRLSIAVNVSANACQ